MCFSGIFQQAFGNLAFLILLALITAGGLQAARRGEGRLEPLPEIPSELSAIQDLNEPNNSPAEATPLAFLDSLTGVWTARAEGLVDNSLDFDFFSLELRAGDSLLITLTGLDSLGSLLDPVMSLLDSTGAVLTHSLGDTVAGFRAGYAGRYFVMLGDRAFLDGRSFSAAADRAYILLARRLNRRGDVDGDGALTYRDAFLVFFLVSGALHTSAFTPAQLAAADFNGNGLLRGDILDFLGLLHAVSVPARNPDSGVGKSGASLASAGESWLLEFDDRSAVRLRLDGAVELVEPGEDAAELLALLGERNSKPVPPRAFSLDQNSPNPFNPSTSISFSLPGESSVCLEVFDLRGRRVAVPVRGAYPAGTHTVIWNGTGTDGENLSSGVYFYRLSAPGISLTRKMVLVK